MAIKIRPRRDTGANWTAADPVLDMGELGIETDHVDGPKPKIGDGVTPWTLLPYLAADGADGADGANGADGRDGEQWWTYNGVAPDDLDGEDGDLALRVDTGDIFEKAAGTWGVAIGNIMGPAGADGADGVDGTNGQGVPIGGTAGQVLAKIDATDYNTEWVDQSGGGSGAGDGTQRGAVRATLSATTAAFTVDTATLIAFDAVDADPDGFFDTALGRFAPTEPGYYWLYSNLAFDAVTNDSRIGVIIRVNGAQKAANYSSATSKSLDAVSVGALLYFDGVSDYAEIYAVHGDSGGSRSVYGTTLSGLATIFEAFRVGHDASSVTTPTIAEKTAAYTLVEADNGDIIEVDATSAAVTITLPAGLSDGFQCMVVKTDASANAVTLAGDGTSSVVGKGTDLTAQHDVATVYRKTGDVYRAVGDVA